LSGTRDACRGELGKNTTENRTGNIEDNLSEKKKSTPHGKSAKEKSREVAPSPSKGTLGLKIWQADLLACVVIFLAVFLLFNELILRDLSFSKGDDTEASTAWNSYVEHEVKAGRDFPAWCPYLFGGFPSLAAGAYSNYNEMGPPYSIARKWLNPRYWADIVTTNVLLLGAGKGEEANQSRWLISLFLYGGLLTYLLMRQLSFRPLISLLSALVMAWNPYLISLATAAHGGKLMTFIYFPLILLLTHRVLEKRRLFDFALLALAFAWDIAWGGHTQIVYYAAIMSGLYWLVWSLWDIKAKPLGWIAPGLMIAAAGLLGLANGALWYMPLYEFVPYSIRGMPAAFATGAAGGYSMEQAAMWSFHPKEILTFIAPSWFGLKSPQYWGPMPFTTSSFYFGIVPLLFAILAFFSPKNRTVVALGVISAVALFMSFGEHFMSFFKLLFDYLPMFSKFRTPSLIVLLVGLSGIILAAFGLRFVAGIEKSERWRRVFLFGTIASVVLLFIVLVGGSSLQGLFGSFEKPGEFDQYMQQLASQGVPQAQAQANVAQYLTNLRAERFSMLHTDLIVAFLLLALAFAASMLRVMGKVTRTQFILIVLATTAIDMWMFANKFFEPQRIQGRDEMFVKDSPVQYLEQDKSLYRIFPVGNLLQDNRWAYFAIQSLGGYQGAKMRSYQDLLENVFYHGSNARFPLHLPLVSSLNCKYVLSDLELPGDPTLKLIKNPKGRRYLYENLRVLPRAYFVDSVAVISDREQALKAMQQPDFQPDYWAIADHKLPGEIQPTPNRSATVTTYAPHKVELVAETDRPSFLVLSDAYYKPGWKAIVDGKAADIFLVNTFVRGLYLSPGRHHIQYSFRSASVQAGIAISTISHFVVWGLVIVGFWLVRKERMKKTAPKS
jgi:hypothetical protein